MGFRDENIDLTKKLMKKKEKQKSFCMELKSCKK